MPHSYAEHTDLTCPHCGGTFSAEIWLIVDVAEQPDLAELIRDGTLHDLTCSHCSQAVAQADAPLLLSRPGEEQPLLFSPTQRTTAEQDREQAAGLVGLLREISGDVWRDEWANQLAIVPRELLPIVLIEGIEANWQASEDTPLLQALQQFIQAKTWAASQRIVERHPDLLSDEAEALLKHLIDTVREQGNEKAVHMLQEHRTLLRRCREAGVVAAFAEKAEASGIDVPPEFRNDLNRAIAARDHLEMNQDPGTINAAVVAWERILERPEIEAYPKFREAIRAELGAALWRRFEALENMTDLDRAIAAHEQALAMIQGSSPDLAGWYNNLGVALNTRFEVRGELMDLEAAIAAYEKALAVVQGGSPDRAMYEANLGDALLSRFEALGHITDVDAAIAACENALTAVREGSPDWAGMEANLGNALRARFKALGEVADLDAAMVAYEKALAVAQEGSLDWANMQNNVGLTLVTRFEALGEVADLDAAITAYEKALTVAREGSPDWANTQNNLGLALVRRFEVLGEVADLDVAIAAYGRALAAAQESSPGWANMQNNLGLALVIRSEALGGVADLDTAIAAYEKALAVVREGSPGWAGRQNNLGSALIRRFETLGELGDLDAAIATYAKALAVAREGSPDWARWQANLGNGLRTRFEALGELADLDAAIAAYEKALTVAREGAPDWANMQNNLGLALVARSEALGEVADLDAAIAAYQRALAVAWENSPGWASMQVNLGIALVHRFEAQGEAVDLYAAIAAYEKALAVAQEDSPGWARWQSNLGVALRLCFEAQGEVADLDAAIAAFEKALTVAREDSPDWARWQANLGNALLSRFEALGQITDLDAATAAYKKALSVAQEGTVDWAGWQNNLGVALVIRFEALGEVADLDAAISAYEKALTIAQEDSPGWAGWQNNLGVVLSTRFETLGAIADLDAAIAAYEKALTVVREGSPDWASVQTNLGVSLRTRFNAKGEVADLDAAIAAYEEALTVAQEGAPGWAVRQNNLGSALLRRFEALGQIGDLDAAITAYEKALAVTHEGSPGWASRQANLGSALRTRFEALGVVADLDAAIATYRMALASLEPDMWPNYTLIASLGLGNLCFSRSVWAEAAEALAHGVRAINNLSRAQLLGTGREAWLGRAGGIYRHAAYALSRTGRPNEAAAILEQGRARSLSAALARDRTDLDQVKVEDPEAYDRYQQAAARLRQLEARERIERLLVTEGRIRLTDEDLRAQAKRARADLDAAIERIQRIPGYEEFLAEPDFDDIALAVQLDLPLVYLVATPVGSLVLVVHPPSVKPVWLNDFTETDLERLLFGATREELNRRFAGGRVNMLEVDGWFGAYARRWEDHQSWHNMLEQITQRLWDVLMGPVVDCLEALAVQQVVLVPTGLLALLPLHAAWTEQDGRRRYALDSVAFSYAPSARVLTHAQRIATMISEGQLLAVDEPWPVNARRLDNSRAEVAAITSLFDSPQILAREQATRQDVLAKLSEVQIAHFACHGETNWQEPLQNGLLMTHDEMLTVQDLFSLHLEGARLATLSACETGIIGTKLPDEVVALPAAFMQAGFAGVVASLWSVADLSTAMLMERFYRLWREEGLTPALALREAQIWLRDTTNREKAEYFKRDIPVLSGTRMPEPIAADFFSHVMSRRPDARDFEHPFWWAAFYLTGV